MKGKKKTAGSGGKNSTRGSPTWWYAGAGVHRLRGLVQLLGWSEPAVKHDHH